jgi:hypothetical protein
VSPRLTPELFLSHCQGFMNQYRQSHLLVIHELATFAVQRAHHGRGRFTSIDAGRAVQIRRASRSRGLGDHSGLQNHNTPPSSRPNL